MSPALELCFRKIHLQTCSCCIEKHYEIKTDASAIPQKRYAIEKFITGGKIANPAKPVNGQDKRARPAADSRICLCWWADKGQQQKLLLPLYYCTILFIGLLFSMRYSAKPEISTAKRAHCYQFSAECRSTLLGYIQTFSYCWFQSPHCLLPGLSHQYPKSGREYQMDQPSSCR